MSPRTIFTTDEVLYLIRKIGQEAGSTILRRAFHLWNAEQDNGPPIREIARVAQEHIGDTTEFHPPAVG